MKSILAVIPARQGSQGIIGKNKKNLRGVPLVAYSLKIATEILNKYSNVELVVSTNDPDIIDIAHEVCDLKFELRPEYLSSNTSLISDVIKYELNKSITNRRNFDSILLLQPTSPLRKVVDVESCLNFWKEHEVDSLISVCQPGNMNVFTSYYVDSSLQRFAKGTAVLDSLDTNRQSQPRTLSRNGAIYLVDTKAFLKEDKMYTNNPWCFEMPRDRSFNLDDDFDWNLLESWMISKDIYFENFF
jgi:CMP-N,N'-diacetyllegionaminic acid synthase